MSISKEVVSRLEQDTNVFSDGVKGFFSKELAPKDFKGISGGFGSYAERGFESAMLRLRIPGGRITQDRMKFLLRMIKELKLSYIHFTTGQNIQFHRLQGEQVIELYKEAFKEGLFSRGSGGDHFRNVTASPLRGVHKDEYFDISPYVEAAHEFIISMIGTLSLPRKYKTGFSSVDNDGHATFKEMGFLAAPNGTFDVYAAGGIGGGSRFGVKVDSQVNPSDILYYMKAMAYLYHDHGDFKNRGKARARFIAEKLGNDEFVRLFQEYLKKVKSTEDLSFEFQTQEFKKISDGTVPTTIGYEQKQQGLYYIQYKPLHGTPPIDVFVKLTEYVSTLQDVEYRVNSDESIYIINLTGTEVDAVNSIIDATNAKNNFEHSVSCVGSAICQIGFQDSSGLLEQIIASLREAGIKYDKLPQIHISGCPSSCGTHQIGHIGLHGFTKLVDKKPQPAFKLFVGGNYEATKEKMSKEVGVISITDIPQFFKDLALTLNEADENFVAWYKNHEEEFIELAKPYL